MIPPRSHMCFKVFSYGLSRIWPEDLKQDSRNDECSLLLPLVSLLHLLMSPSPKVLYVSATYYPMTVSRFTNLDSKPGKSSKCPINKSRPPNGPNIISRNSQNPCDLSLNSHLQTRKRSLDPQPHNTSYPQYITTSSIPIYVIQD